jgi:hypothetical protein
MLGPDEDEAGAHEVHEWMTAHRAESDDGPPAPSPHFDLVGTRRDMVANGPFTGGRCVPLVSRLPIHAATLQIDMSRPWVALRPAKAPALLADTCHRNDPRDQTLNRFGPEAGARSKGYLTARPIKSGHGSPARCGRRGGRSSRREGGSRSASTLAKVIETVAQPAIFRVFRVLRGPRTEPD